MELLKTHRLTGFQGQDYLSKLRKGDEILVKKYSSNWRVFPCHDFLIYLDLERFDKLIGCSQLPPLKGVA
jgi:hypothetical protein